MAARMPAPAPSRHPAPGARAPLAIVLALVTIFIVYGSLYPFAFRQQQPSISGPAGTLLNTWQEWDRRGDLLSNILLYMPFGFLFTHSLSWRVPSALRALLAIVAATALSASMELLQFYDEGRVTSMGDVYANMIGSAAGAIASVLLGASMRWPFVRQLGRQPDAALLLAMFLGYRLYPYVPVIDMHKYLRAVHELRQETIPPPGDLVRFVVTWLFIAAVIEAAYGFRLWLPLFPAFAAVVFLGRILIVDLSLADADVAGAAIAFILWLGLLHRLPGRNVILACLFAGLIVALRLEPFTFSSVPLRGFGWVPLWSLMNGSISVAMQAFFEKSCQYGGLIWLLRRGGMSLAGATILTAMLLLVTSYAEAYLPGRSGEVTDATIAVMIGVVFHLLGGVALRGASGHASEGSPLRSPSKA
jgi:VanZ family protein